MANLYRYLRFGMLTTSVLASFFSSCASIADATQRRFEIIEALSAEPGDANRGKTIVLNSDKASCLLCHSISQIDEDFQGNIGPDLSLVGNRYSAAQLRFRLVEPRALNPKTIMPSYWQKSGFSQLDRDYEGKSVYTAQELEDVIAYLLTLTKQRSVRSVEVLN